MDFQAEYVEAMPSVLAYQNFSFYKTEDSGYHTSFTPGSLERSELSSDYLDQSLLPTSAYISTDLRYTPEVITRSCRKYSALKHSDNETPLVRRALKRPHPSADFDRSPLPTPTTYIAGKIESLEVNEDKENTHTTEKKLQYAKSAKRYLCKINTFETSLAYPVTPIKRNCSTSPCKGSARKLDFTIHTLTCDKNVLQSVNIQTPQAQQKKHVLARPDQKIDLVHLLHQSSAIPPLKKIFCYLTIQDVRNFCSVSTKWNEVWAEHNTEEKKQELKKYVRAVKENQENGQAVITPKVIFKPYDGCLKEIHNEINDNSVNHIVASPPHTPKSNKFRKFIKSASQDLRVQLCCIRCSQPAKVTEELTGEMWVDCTNVTCGFQFCKFCNSPRHPGKSCFQYDLNGPSPSKRKKCENVIGTKKSRKNLRRLL